MMTKEEISELNRGDIVRHASGYSYIVIDSYNGNVLAIRGITVSNGTEWTLVKRHDWTVDSEE